MKPPRITDVCLIPYDFEAAKSFYIEKLGYKLSSEMPGFADFEAGDVFLAIWDGQKIRDVTGANAQVEAGAGHQVMVAIEKETPEDIDRIYQELSERGVEFYDEPKNHAWNARCIYFSGPCGELWEFFAWLPGGKPGQVGA